MLASYSKSPGTYNPFSTKRIKNTALEGALNLPTAISPLAITSFELPRCDSLLTKRMSNLTLGEILKRYAIISHPTITIFGLPIWDPIFSKKIENLTVNETLKIRALIPPPSITSFEPPTSPDITFLPTSSNLSTTPIIDVGTGFRDFSSGNIQTYNTYLQEYEARQISVENEDLASKKILFELSLLSPVTQQKDSAGNYLGYHATCPNPISLSSTVSSDQFWSNSYIIN